MGWTDGLEEEEMNEGRTGRTTDRGREGRAEGRNEGGRDGWEERMRDRLLKRRRFKKIERIGTKWDGWMRRGFEKGHTGMRKNGQMETKRRLTTRPNSYQARGRTNPVSET